MNCADRLARAIAAGATVVLACTLGACGGGSTSETTIIGGGLTGASGGTLAAIDTPTGANTTEIVVDSGPAASFSLGATNIPYVTVTVCAPGSTTCATIDHVFLDTGSVGLRLLQSRVSTLGLPAVMVPADAAHATPAGIALECYPFVLGAVWGSLASADIRIGGELASAVPVQLIDDSTPAANTPPADCVTASNGGLLTSAASLQANGILGVGMVAYDCGLNCITGNYASGHTLYYSCSGATCTAAAIPVDLQIQNPVVHFAVDNNGTIISLPSLPDLGVGVARGRLVFGIGTQSNNQIPVTAQMLFVDPNPANVSYLSLATSVDGTNYPDSYIDSGSNALFFDDATIALGCQSSSGASGTTGGWYCPVTAAHRTATITDVSGASKQLNVTIANADALFSTSSLAFSDLGGTVSQGKNTFVWGLPFFYGRSVFTSIWGQALSPNGPWNAF